MCWRDLLGNISIVMNKETLMSFSVKRIMRSVAIVSFVFGGAVSAGAIIGPNAAFAAEPSEQVLQDIRPDLQEVLHALTYRIQGLDFDVSETIMFDEAIGEIADPTGLSYKFLNLQSVALMRFEERGDDRFEAIAVLRFEDAMGRRAFLSVAAQYMARNGRIYIQEAVVEPFYSPQGDAIVLMALSEDLPDFEALQEMPLEEAYLAMMENALLASDLAARNSLSPQRLTVFIFDRVRSHADTAVDVVSQSATKPTTHSVVKINQDGWAYMLLEADFEISDTRLYEIFRVESESHGGNATMLGQFVVGTPSSN